MKQVVTNYKFSSSSKTITLSDFSAGHPVDLKRLYIITDVTTNKILYNFADSSLASANITSNNVINLSTLQGGEGDGDSLQIIYDLLPTDPVIYQSPLLPANASQETGGNLATIVTNQTNGSQVTKITDGTNTANVITPGTANSTGNAILTGNTTLTEVFSYTAITTGPSYDAGNYRWVSVHINTQYATSTVAFQCSNDNVNWVNTSLVSAGATTSMAISTATASPAIYHGPLSGRYFRLNVTGTYTSGICAGTIVFSTTSTSLPSISGATLSVSTGTTGTITTSSSSITTGSLSGYSGFTEISIHGTYAGVSFGVTVSDDAGVTYYNVPIYDATAQAWLGLGATITPGTNASKQYYVPVMPLNYQAKVLASAYTSGTATVHIQEAQSITPGSTMAQIMDAAGNARGANVDSNNNLMVNVNAGSITTVPGVATSGGLSTYSGTIGATVTSVKASTGQLYSWYIDNPNSSVSYVQFFNATTGSVTLGTTAPFFSLGIPANGGSNLSISQGLAFSTAISFACTTTRTGNTAPTNTVDVNFFYN